MAANALRDSSQQSATSNGDDTTTQPVTPSWIKDGLPVGRTYHEVLGNLSKASLQKQKRYTIYGYEFMDVVMNSTRSELKKPALEKVGLAWSPILNEVNCLFCSNLGDAIVGSIELDDFPLCNTLPPNLDYMAASVQSLKALSKRNGGQINGESTRLTQSCYLQLTGSPFQSHQGHSDPCWEHVDFLHKFNPLNQLIRPVFRVLISIHLVLWSSANPSEQEWGDCMTSEHMWMLIA